MKRLLLRRAVWMWVLPGVVFLPIYSEPLEAEALVLPGQELHGVSTLDNTDFLRLGEAENYSVDALQKQDPNFRPMESELLALSDAQAVYYLRFSLVNGRSVPRKLYLELAHPHLEQLVLYSPGPTGVRLSRSGGALPYEIRESTYRNYAFPIFAPPGESVYYLKVQGRGLLRTPLKLWDRQVFERRQVREILWDGLYYGVLFLMFVHFLVVYVVLRDRISMYRALFTLAMTLGLALNDGYGQSLFPGFSYWTTKLAALSFPVINIFLLRFVREGEGTVRRDGKLDRAVDLLTLILSAHVLSFFIIPYGLFVEIMLYLLIPVSGATFLILILAAVNVLRLRRFAYGTLTLGGALLLLCGFLMPFVMLGLLPANFILEQGAKISAMVYMTLMSLGMAIRLSFLNGQTRKMLGRLKHFPEIQPASIPRAQPEFRVLTPETEEKLKQALLYLDENFEEDISREYLAQSLGINADNLGRFFKRYTGMRINEYLNELRIREARRLLLESDQKIIDIAFRVGFESLQTFNRSFSKLVSQTPSEYRKANGGLQLVSNN